MSYKAALINRTPFSADKLELADVEGQLAVLVVVTASYVDVGGCLVPAPKQAPVRFADVYNGIPGESGIKFEADLALEKPAIDVLVIGNAHAPQSRPAESVDVGLFIGDVSKRLRVTGDRRWSAVGRASRAQPFTVMPLVYERAYGGTVRSGAEAQVQAADGRNLVGVGFHGAASSDPAVMTQIANIEYTDERITRSSDSVRPAGYGVVARGWSPRLELAGTFDKAWLDERWPFLPRDFSPKHNQAAPPDQQLARLSENEEVRLLHMTPEGVWSFRLPRLDVACLLCFSDRWEQLQLRMDTICIEPEDKRVSLTSRLAIRPPRSRGELIEIVVGSPSPGRKRAIDEGKQYVELSSRSIVSN